MRRAINNILHIYKTSGKTERIAKRKELQFDVQYIYKLAQRYQAQIPLLQKISLIMAEMLALGIIINPLSISCLILL